ncbi:MAG: YbhB/YbcL family Raf kinase inhibitor-like protein [Methanobacteriaceae archaeon]
MINIESDAFSEGSNIPEKYTCDGADISPPLRWDIFPEHTLSFAILCEDPDAPGGIFTHWILFNIHPDTMELPENMEKKETVEMGMIQGINDFGLPGYGGPCPPKGTEHRYFFRIYALDRTLNLTTPLKRGDFLKALNDSILDEGHLMGKYMRK